MTADAITRFFNAWFDWLEAHRVQNLMLVLVYAAFILLGHDRFVQISIAVLNALTLPVYNLVVGVITVAVGLSFVGLLSFFLRKKSSDRPRKIFYLSTILVLLVLHHFFLFEMNIEVIHAVLYAGLALVLFPFTRRPGATIVLALPVMMMDEWYQYIMLYPGYVHYFDFNDIVMDILGCALLLCGLWIMGVKMRPAKRLFIQRTEVWGISVLVLGSVVATMTCVVALFPQTACSHTLLVVNALPNPLEFWQTHPFTGRTYHVLSPVAGLATVTGLALFFLGMTGASPSKEA